MDLVNQNETHLEVNIEVNNVVVQVAVFMGL